MSQNAGNVLKKYWQIKKTLKKLYDASKIKKEQKILLKSGAIGWLTDISSKKIDRKKIKGEKT